MNIRTERDLLKLAMAFGVETAAELAAFLRGYTMGRSPRIQA
ncbi:hypothetical protein [Nitratifractor sp.]